MSMNMELDPNDRQIYVSCPECNTKVFDNGLEK